MTHNAAALYLFTNKMLTHLRNSPDPSIDVLHRWSDNCAVQYKCVEAFAHLPMLERENNIHIVYHYTEAGHGKSPSDGLGATTKKKLDRIMLSGKTINNAYYAYLALVKNETNVQREKNRSGESISYIYIPTQEIQKRAPKKTTGLKSLKGTQQFHMVHSYHSETTVVECNDLSCSCDVCLRLVSGPCKFGKFKMTPKMLDMTTGKIVSSQQLADHDVKQTEYHVDNQISKYSFFITLINCNKYIYFITLIHNQQYLRHSQLTLIN